LLAEVRKPSPETVAAMVEARAMAAARYGSAKELFDALDKNPAKSKCAPLPRKSDHTRQFGKGWGEVSQSGKQDTR
jgi:predicted Zn-dependent protease